MAVKWMGYLLILLSCRGLGARAAGRLKARRNELKCLRGWLSFFRGKLLYEGATAEEALRESAGQAGKPFADFFRAAADSLKNREGVSLAEIWEREAGKFRKKCSLSDGEYGDFLRFGGTLGQMDRELQLRAAAFYEENLDGALAAVNGEIAVKDRLYRSLGILAGCFIVILIW